MTNQTSLQDLYMLAKSDQSLAFDYEVKARDLIMDSSGMVHYTASAMEEVKPARFNKHSYAHLLGMSKGTQRNPLLKGAGKAMDYLWQDCPPDLQAVNTNFILKQMGQKKLLVRQWHGGEDPTIRAVCSSRYGIFDPVHLLGAISRWLNDVQDLSKFDPKLGYYNLTEDFVSGRLYFGKLGREIWSGDYGQAYAAGIAFQTDAVKRGSLSVVPFVQGGRCENSTLFLSDEEGWGISRVHTGLDQATGTALVYGVLNSCISAAPQILATVAEAAIRQMENPQTLFNNIAEQFGLGTEAALGMSLLSSQQGGSTALGVSNGVTAYAKLVDDPYTRTKMEVVGGRILTMEERQLNRLFAGLSVIED